MAKIPSVERLDLEDVKTEENKFQNLDPNQSVQDDVVKTPSVEKLEGEDVKTEENKFQNVDPNQSVQDDVAKAPSVEKLEGLEDVRIAEDKYQNLDSTYSLQNDVAKIPSTEILQSLEDVRKVEEPIEPHSVEAPVELMKPVEENAQTDESQVEETEHDASEPAADEDHVMFVVHQQDSLDFSVPKNEDVYSAASLHSRGFPVTPPPTPIKSTEGVDIADSQQSVHFDVYEQDDTVTHTQEISGELLVEAYSEYEAIDNLNSISKTLDEDTVVTPSGSKQTTFKAEIRQYSCEYESAIRRYLCEDDSEYDQKHVTARDYEEEKKRRAECVRYAGVEKFASSFVNKVIDHSINDIVANRSTLQTYLEEESLSPLSSINTYVEVFGTFTRWPRIGDFTKDVGYMTINDYMLTWDYKEEWLHCLDFLLEQSDECSDYYLYEAKWSIPSKPYPIPQATASVYFTIEVSRIKPTYCPVDITYTFEGSRFLHIPGVIPFQEQSLFNIIDAKIQLYKQIQF